MALVSYDNSDSGSDYEEDCESTSQIKAAKDFQSFNIASGAKGINENNDQNIFNALPKPTKSVPKEENDEFLLKKEKMPYVKPKSKITVPSLDDFKDVKRTIPAGVKAKPTNGKKSGLLGLLPQPKSETITSKLLVPQSVKQNTLTNSVGKKLTSAIVSVKTDSSKNKHINEYSDDSDDEIKNDFFSINRPVELPSLEVCQDTKINEIVEKKGPRNLESYFKRDVSPPEDQNDDYLHSDTDTFNTDFETSCTSSAMYNNKIQEEKNTNNIELDEEAILKLCGTRGKRKRESIQIVDVNQQEVLKDAREMLMRGLMADTTKRQSHSKRKGNEPTSQQKRKHQITYLAHQAKANEAELQNQWANNRMSKRMTQSKYGF